MSEEPKKITGFRITPTATGIAEPIQADECRLEHIPTHIFLHRGKEVRRIVAGDLVGEPVPTYPQTPEGKQAWIDLQARARKINQRKNLKRG